MPPTMNRTMVVILQNLCIMSGIIEVVLQGPRIMNGTMVVVLQGLCIMKGTQWWWFCKASYHEQNNDGSSARPRYREWNNGGSSSRPRIMNGTRMVVLQGLVS